MSPAKTGKLIEMPFEWIMVGPKEPLDGRPDRLRGKGNFGGLSGPLKSIENPWDELY